MYQLAKQKNLSLSRNLALWTFGELVNLLYLFYSGARSCCLLHLIKQNCLLKACLRTLILVTQICPLSFFLSRTNLKLHNIFVTPKQDKKVITSLYLSQVPNLDCIPVVDLENCELLLSYIQAELINMCLKETCFLDFWKISSVISLFKYVGERWTAKNYCAIIIFHGQ